MIIITKDLIYLEYFEDKKKMSLEIDHEVNRITTYMDHIVHIEDGVTVKDIFAHLGKDVEAIDLVFDASLGGYNFDEFLKEAMLKPVKDDLLAYAVFEHKCNVDTDELEHEIRFAVMGKHPENDVMVPYSVELSAINSYADLKVKIDTKFSITKIEVINDESIELNLFESIKSMTLYEVISALLFEVSYYGTPTMRKKVFDEMKAQVISRLESGELDSEISASIITAAKEDDIKELEIELEKSIFDENYETSASLRDKINDLKRKGRKK